ncbi:MAG: sigma-54-dependent transcriptional regulator, partial [Nitrospiria bacterium]
DEKMRRLLELILSQEGYRVHSVSSGEQAVQRLSEQSGTGGYDLVVTDLQMPGMTGLDVLEHVKKEFPEIPVLIVTGFGTVKTAVEAMKKGAFDYITKPIDNEELKWLVKRALEIQRLFIHHKQLSQELRERFHFDSIIGKSEEMRKIKALSIDVSDTDYTVLIMGESGTGKEMVARAIHYSSRRSRYPMVAINCGAIPETLLESELFGYIKGAFTDAKTSKPGRLKMADGGTVFLDEVAELTPMTQVKLLRVLQEKEIEPLGGTKSIKIDIRIVAATNKDLFEQVKKGSFREDLYYRVNVFPVLIPPLRERNGDIPLLLDFFVNKYNREIGNRIKGFSPEALAVLERYPWPGNVRELANLVERMMTICKGRWVEIGDLPPGFASARPGESGTIPLQPSGTLTMPDTGASLLSMGLSMEELEERLIREALESTSENVTEAARLLKTTRNTLRYRIQKYGLLRPK